MRTKTKWNPIQCWWDCKLVHLLCNTAVPLLRIYPKDSKLNYHRDDCSSVFIAVLFTAVLMKPTQVSNNGGTDKENIVCIHNDSIYFPKENEIMPFAGNCMQLDIIMSNELNQYHNDKYCMFSLICDFYILYGYIKLCVCTRHESRS